MVSPSTAASLAALVTLAALAVALLPLALGALAVAGLVFGYVLLDIIRNRFLFRMSIRYFARKPVTTALVLGGLMVGTAIISATAVVNDTMDNMVVGQTVKGMGEMDFLVGNDSGPAPRFFDSNLVASTVEGFGGIPGVKAAGGLVTTTAGVEDRANSLRSSAVGVMGLTPDLVSDFGGFVAVDGSALTSLPAADQAFVNEELADALGAREGDSIALTRGASAINLTVEAIVKDEGLGGFQESAYAFVTMATAQDLSGHPGQYNVIAVSLADHPTRDGPAVEEVRRDINATLAPYGHQMAIVLDKAVEITEGRDEVSSIISTFLVFGSFSIVAGVVLVVSIFTMLGEERKGELGVARAVGMRRGHLQRLLVYEGVVYAGAASAIGTVVGLLLAYTITLTLPVASVPSESVGLHQYFSFTPLSLALSFLAGYLLTLGSIYLVTRRIARLNIVRAMRGLPEPPVPRGSRAAFLLGAVAVSIGLSVMTLGVASESLAAAMVGLSLLTTSSGLLLRKYVGDRLAWTASGLTTLFIWLPKVTIFPYDPDIEVYFVAGIFMVSSALVVLMFNSDAVVALFTKLLRVRGAYRAVVRTAVSYPLKSRLRTALNIFIFGLVVLTVTTMSMISGIMTVGIPQRVADTSGGFDIVAFSNPAVEMAPGMWEQINNTADGKVWPQNVTGVVSLVSGQAVVTTGPLDRASGESGTFPYTVVGFNSLLFTEGNYPLDEWDRARYASEAEVWDATLNDPSLAIVDGTAMDNDLSRYTGIGGSGLTGTEVGDRLILTSATGENRTVTVVGVTRQNAFEGVFVQEALATELLGSPGSDLFLIKLAPGLDSDQQSVLLESQFFSYQLTTLSMKSLAQKAVSQIDSMFGLIRAFLALGLLIGISGLGIVTIRSIHERRVEIGMMRAIGFTRRMVLVNFALESAFASLLGILIGSALGILVGYQLWDTGFRPMHFEFLVPWEIILLADVATFLATLLIVVPAARGSGKVSPAEVLKFE